METKKPKDRVFDVGSSSRQNTSETAFATSAVSYHLLQNDSFDDLSRILWPDERLSHVHLKINGIESRLFKSVGTDQYICFIPYRDSLKFEDLRQWHQQMKNEGAERYQLEKIEGPNYMGEEC